MRVAVWHDLHSGGGKRALYHHLRALAERGDEVEIWTSSDRDVEWSDLGEFGPQHVHPLEYDAGWTRAERLRWRPRSERLLAAVESHARRAAAEIEAGGFDILFANSSYRTAVSPVGRFCVLPSVLYLQEPWRDFYEARPDFYWRAPEPGPSGWRAFKAAVNDRRDSWSARIQVREEARNARAHDRVLCNSLYSRESILRAYGLDSHVCYLGVDVEQFEPNTGPRGDFVVGLGSFIPAKNPRFCIEALAAVPAPRPPLIWIANTVDEGHRAEMTSLAERLGVVLDLRAKIPDAEVRSLLGRAQAMLYASRLEPLGLAPLEANACGTPVIAVAEAGVRETVVDGVNGLLVGADPVEMGRAVRKLRDDPALAARLGASGRRVVEERWTSQAAGRCVAEQLDETLRRSRAR